VGQLQTLKLYRIVETVVARADVEIAHTDAVAHAPGLIDPGLG
jgi:hypothetical protein